MTTLWRVVDFIGAVGWLWMALEVWTGNFPVPLLVQSLAYAAVALHFVYRP